MFLVSTNGFKVISRLLGYSVVLSDSWAIVVGLVILTLGHLSLDVLLELPQLSLFVLLVHSMAHLLVFLLRGWVHVPSEEAGDWVL